MRRRIARAVAAGGGAIAVLAALVGCAPSGSASSAQSVEDAIRAADLGWTDVSASSRLDGFAHQLGVTLTQDASDTELDPDRLRATLEIIDTTAGDAGFSYLELGVYSGPQGTGDLLAVWPAAEQLGFENEADRPDADFTVPMSTVHDVVG